VALEELQVLHFHGVPAADLADDTGHGVGMAGPVEGRARVVQVDAIQRGGEAVRVAFAADLAIAHDVQARLLLEADGEQRRVVLSLREMGLLQPPELEGAHTWWKSAGELRAIDQPFRLWVASDDGGGK
jgi:hypothetical protein